ncbi:MAG TPA: tripartite tricarboxylate transporter substrate binding protein [Hyphomicrobiaceae bacterium]|jgi:tripartite-type tricarboxylate transporter receptor subunit TctC|nr:tripartite tricarboxylate transporter substrate binding protein [Hyphomicrobiaceae bacterium]
MAFGFRNCIVTAALCLGMALSNSAAADWPERPITLVHGFGTGGNADLVSRAVADRLAARLGQAVVVEAKPGGGGRTAALFVTRAPADGYTLTMLPGGHATSAAMHEQLPYDPVRDFTWIGMVTESPFIIATYPEHPIKTVADLIAAAKSAPSPLIYGTSGVGTSQHLLTTLFASKANIELKHLPAKSGAAVSTMLLGKHLELMVDSPPVILELSKAGQLRPIATSGPTRYWALPDVPTIGETVPGFEGTSYFGLAGPPNMPTDIVKRLNGETVDMGEDAQMIERLKVLGSLPYKSTPDGFKARVVADIERWTALVKEAGIKRIGAQ